MKIITRQYSFYLPKINNRLAVLCFYSLLILIGVAGCVHRVDLLSIKGTFSVYPKSQVFINRFDGEKLVLIDSFRTNNNGEFDLTLDCDSPYILSIGVSKTHSPIVLLAEPDRELTIIAEESDISRYNVSGSEGSILIQNLNAKLTKVKYQIDSISNIYKVNLDNPKIDSIQHSLDSIFKIILTKHRDFTYGIIKNNPYSLVSILALYQSYDSILPVLNYSKDKELFSLVDKSLNSVYSSNSIVKNFHSKIIKLDSLFEQQQKRELMFKEGNVLPDVSFSLISGESFFVSSIWFKYILIDFWASWQPESKVNNENLKNIYKEFGPKGLVILQVSIGANIDSLKFIVARDTLSWYHAYVQNIENAKLLDTLKVTSLPANYITDRRGYIKALNLSGDNLKSKLKELLP